MSSHNGNRRHLTHDQIDAIVQRHVVGGRCPVCGRLFYPTRVTDPYCMCEPIKIRDVLANRVDSLCRELAGV
jgi:uncharacterized OB-fold protein